MSCSVLKSADYGNKEKDHQSSEQDGIYIDGTSSLYLFAEAEDKEQYYDEQNYFKHAYIRGKFE
ncbi:hypothetical protein [Maridesulfovibrio bastinii]|uniref:hypothetical protein n=1 Tax=Maridesulfovibrio bastinii TaxID=47157 RepID=UPI0003FBFBE9|nr:hypothetical protein [Maridesulfovibrio bastinii]